ncbi:hypothetical protein Cgig2_018974 [Carnegiea gigantea]|uniref:Glycosyltransferase n=1 Tax=Carnegiea gigantea TaxID=171969 RepID=A0A9Q1K0Z7_9CARY|nr:hypothetical protein Cgig2_018974 [Carnegiea gigantea]
MDERAEKRGHVLVVPYPSQGHINPTLQFSRRLVSKGVKATLAITNYIFKTFKPTSDGHVGLATISDGYDEGSFASAGSVDTYLDRMEAAGSQTLGDLIEAYAVTPHPITCLIYDSFFPWALDVAKKYGLVGGPFFTQACAVNYTYFLIHHGKLNVPPSSVPVEIPGLPPLEVGDLPSFVGSPESYPAYLRLVVNQNINLDKADFVLVNTYYELEDKVVNTMSRECPTPLLTIGPTVPSLYLDNKIEDDKDYGLNLFYLGSIDRITHWLSTKPPKSVVYVSFGSMACLPDTQMEELARGLKACGHDFLWVVRASEEDKLPSSFAEEVRQSGLLVRWSPQLEVLANEAIGCFFTHCGWNSTVEALALGVPMIGMPQWTDQPMNAKLIQDVWKVGVRVKVDKDGLVTREEIEDRIKEVMVGERGEEIRENAKRWRDLTNNAYSQGGSSDRMITEFVSKVVES